MYIYRLTVLISLAMLCLTSVSATSQTTEYQENEQGEVASVKPAKEGTYQFIKTGKGTDVFTTSVLVEIEERRSQNREVRWEYSKNTTIIILSKNRINKKNFEPIQTNAPWN